MRHDKLKKWKLVVSPQLHVLTFTKLVSNISALKSSLQRWFIHLLCL